MLKVQQHWIRNITVVAIFASIYFGMFLWLHSYVGYGGAPFAAVTVIAAGWLFGARGGFLVSLLVTGENLLLYRLASDSTFISTLRRGTFAGMIALMMMGIAVGHMSDLHRKVKQYAHQLRRQAFHDPLTDLANRTLFSDRLEHAAARVARGRTSIAILFLDLDGFKRINDRDGHTAGDRVLQAVADRLRSAVRTADTVARLGGDEFVVLLEDLDELDSARETADRIAQQLSQPFMVDGNEYTITASIGVAFCPAGQSRSEDLLREADQAMYVAKTSGRARYEVGQPLLV